MDEMLRVSQNILWNHSFILLSVIEQFHSLFQSEFSTECDLVVPLSIYSFVDFGKLIYTQVAV